MGDRTNPASSFQCCDSLTAMITRSTMMMGSNAHLRGDVDRLLDGVADAVGVGGAGRRDPDRVGRRIPRLDYALVDGRSVRVLARGRGETLPRARCEGIADLDPYRINVRLFIVNIQYLLH